MEWLKCNLTEGEQTTSVNSAGKHVSVGVLSQIHGRGLWGKSQGTGRLRAAGDQARAGGRHAGACRGPRRPASVGGAVRPPAARGLCDSVSSHGSSCASACSLFTPSSALLPPPLPLWSLDSTLQGLGALTEASPVALLLTWTVVKTLYYQVCESEMGPGEQVDFFQSSRFASRGTGLPGR